MARSIAIALAISVSVCAASVSAQQPGIQRKSVIQQDGPPGYQTIVNVLEFAPGAREIRHTHPGPLTGYVLEGALTLEHEGRATRTYGVGEAFFVEAGKIHVGSNEATMPLKFLATLVVEKDKPPSRPAP